jgi:hypothetical protein
MENNILLPFELINKILIMRPTHPMVNVLNNDIKKWGMKRTYFYKYYFNTDNITKKRKERDYNIENKKHTIKVLLENKKHTIEEAITLLYESKLQKIRLNKKLSELNIKSYECVIVTHFPKRNKHGNFSEVYYKNKGIIY